jgi:hypothetical protein
MCLVRARKASPQAAGLLRFTLLSPAAEFAESGHGLIRRPGGKRWRFVFVHSKNLNEVHAKFCLSPMACCRPVIELEAPL